MSSSREKGGQSNGREKKEASWGTYRSVVLNTRAFQLSESVPQSREKNCSWKSRWGRAKSVKRNAKKEIGEAGLKIAVTPE